MIAEPESAPPATTPNPVHVDWETIGNETYLRLTVPRDPAATGVTITGEASATLAADSWSSVGVVVASKLFRVRDSVPVSSAACRFMRLRFTQLD